LKKDYLTNFFVFIIIYFIVLSSISIIGNSMYYVYNLDVKSKAMTKHIIEYDDKLNNGEYDTDLTYLCNSVKCKGVYNTGTNKLFELKSNGLLKISKDDYSVDNITYLYDNVYIYNENLLLYNDTSMVFFLIKWDEYFGLMKIVILIDLFASLLLAIPTYRSIQKERFNSMLVQISTETMLNSKNIIEITENLHHEINSPLEDIYNHTELIKREITKNFGKTRTKNCKDVNLEKRFSAENKILEWFDIIEISERQIFEKIALMSNFKHLKYNDKKKRHINQLISASKALISTKSLGYDITIDENLKKYVCRDIPESDIIGIFLNHFKNSIDVDVASSVIVVKLINEEMIDGELFIKIFLIDNGNGIPEEFVPFLFEANISTKDSSGVLRGNGMFLSKYLLNKLGGDISLYETSTNGTILELTIPVNKLEVKDEDLSLTRIL